MKRFIAFLAVVGLLLGGGFIFLQLVLLHRVNSTSYAKIDRGMTVAEVEGILGAATATGKEHELGGRRIVRRTWEVAGGFGLG
jgi:hypothetical protein